jgi:hypothetical protein
MIVQDTSRRAEIGVVEVISIGEAIPLIPVSDYHMNQGVFEPYRTIYHYNVVAIRHNMNWPGTDSPITFAVEGVGQQGPFYGVIQMWGFFQEEECYQFLTDVGERKYQAWDRNGNVEYDTRKGRGLSDAMVRRFSEKID